MELDMNKCRIMVLLIFCSYLGSAFGGDRWRTYVNNDWHELKHNLNVNTLFYSGAWLSGMYFLSHFDEALNTSVKSLYNGGFKHYFNAVDRFGNALYVIPAMAGITGLSLTGNDQKFQDAAFTSLQASIVAAFLSGIGKYIVGRSRPYEKKGAHYFSPFRGLDESFPSGHSSTAFAFITPWVYYYPGPLTYILLAIPASTALARMIFDRHWATDVLTGSLIGILVGYNLARWHKEVAAEKKIYSGNAAPKRIAFYWTFSL